MAESEGEIEYLDEDADLVQQCVKRNLPDLDGEESEQNKSLLVERSSRAPKRKKIEDSDSEYDPPGPQSSRRKKVTKKTKTQPRSVVQNKQQQPNKTVKVKEDRQTEYLSRKKYNIRIPDYDDPLCLPVRAIKSEESDIKRLNNWNNVCLEHFRHCDMMLKPEQGETKKSVRTAVFKNVVNNQKGITETTIWSKTTVENEHGDKKSEIFQSALPRYKERKLLRQYVLNNFKTKRSFRSFSEVVLSKEVHSNSENLVVYKPRDSLSAVYSLVDKRKSTEEASPASVDTKMYLKEQTCVRMCAPCYHTAWRGYRPRRQKSLSCPMCGRYCVTVYNLLAHYKTHAAAHVSKYKRVIAHQLAQIVGYHYKCRICRRPFGTIKALREHLPAHNCVESFQCEVCYKRIAKSL